MTFNKVSNTAVVIFVSLLVQLYLISSSFVSPELITTNFQTHVDDYQINQDEDIYFSENNSLENNMSQSLSTQDSSSRASLNYENNVQIINYTIKQGDTLTTIWDKFNINSKGAILAHNAIKKSGIKNFLKYGQVLELQISNNDITGIRKKLGNYKVLILDGNAEFGYESIILKPEITETKRKVAGMINSSFGEAAKAQRIPYQVVDEIIDLFADRVEFSKDIQSGDKYHIIYEHKETTDGKILTPGKIIAASITNNNKQHFAIKFGDKDKYYDKNGEPIGIQFLRYPVQFTRISSMFSKSRFHPVKKVYKPHNGVDFAAPRGTPVRSISDGIVTHAAYSKSAGYYIKIKHNATYSSAYLHLNKIYSNVKVGRRVSKADVIGSVGSTGYATGPHLHFAIYKNGKYVDPLKVKIKGMSSSNQKAPLSFIKEKVKSLDFEIDDRSIALEQNQASSDLG